jgi:hypothetical protein
MPQEQSKDIVQSQESVLDEMGIEAIKERVKALKAEVKRFEESEKLVREAVAEATARYETTKAIQELVRKHHKKITPTHEYEALPEYWELRGKEVEYQIYDNDKQFQGQLSMAEARIKDAQFSKQSSQEQLDKDLASLEKAGVKLDE